MIITCEECATRFQLDDTRVPEKGVRVRCSRCQHAFFVKPTPEAGPDPVERAVSQALEEDAMGDIPERPAESSPPVESPDELDERLGEPREPNESDWEFNHDDDPGHDAAFAEAQDVVADLLDGGSPDEAELAAKAAYFGESDSVEGEIAALLGDGSESLEIDDERSPSAADALGSTQTGAALADAADASPDEPEPPAPANESGLDLADDEDLFGDAAGEIGAPSSDELGIDHAAAREGEEPDVALISDTAGSDALAASHPDEALGSPDEWNLFAGEADAADSAEVAHEDASRASAAPTGVVLGKLQLGPPGGFESAAAHEDPPLLEAEASPLAAWVGRVGSGVGWVATLSFAAIVLGVGLAPQAVPLAASIVAPGLIDVQARRVDNTFVGPMILIEATLRASEAAAASSGTRFAVQILDANGTVLAEDAASLGPALPEPALREARPEDLRALLAEAAAAAAWRPTTLSRQRTLHALLAEVPAAATHFEIVRIPVEPSPAPVESDDASESAKTSG